MEFVLILKEDFKSNTYFNKLLINRVEHQILCNIYNSYKNKEHFDQTTFYIKEIKNILSIKLSMKPLNIWIIFNYWN